MMPHLSGYELCRQIKRQPAFQHTPVILLTSHSAPPEIIQGLAIAVRCGATKDELDTTIGIHPSTAEEFVTMRDKRPDPAAEPPP